MAATLYTTYVWQRGDTLRRVAGRLMTSAGATDALTFGEDIRAANLPSSIQAQALSGVRGVIDWVNGPAIGQPILIPHAS